jgi:outer membrane protein assembly factor BamB
MKKWLAAVCLLLFLVSSVTPTIAGEGVRPVQTHAYGNTMNTNDEDLYNIYRLPDRYSSIPGLPIPDETIDAPQGMLAQNTVKTTSNNGVLIDSIWPIYGHDSFHTGRSLFNTTKNMGQNFWSFQTVTMVMSSPTISRDGTIYIGASRFYAINPNGTMKWEIRDNCETAGAIDDNGTIYFGSARGYDDKFYALYPNGTIKWSIPTTDVRGCPVIAPDGSIIFGEGSGQKITAVYPNGTKKWEFHTNNVVYSSPAVGPDGTIYCGSHDNHIYALYPNGSLKWSYLTGDWVHGSPSIGADGTVYCGSDDGYLYALNPENGSLIWKLQIGQSYASPTIGKDGTLYIGVWEKKFYAINPNGTIQWIFDTSPGKVWGSTAALSNDSTLYFGTCDLENTGGLEIIGLYTNGTVKWRQPIGTVFSSPSISNDGAVYIGGYEYLQAYNEGPLRAEANGPYSTGLGYPIFFSGYVYGGIPPYSYVWDFGDGNSSTEKSPSHTYTNVGSYNVTFTVIDCAGNQSSDTTLATIVYLDPFITKPVNAIYFMNMKIMDFDVPVVFGRITVTVTMQQDPSMIERVEFLIDGKLKATDTTAPYTWTWRLPTFSQYTLTVTAYDTSGKSSQTSIKVWKGKFPL